MQAHPHAPEFRPGLPTGPNTGTPWLLPSTLLTFYYLYVQALPVLPASTANLLASLPAHLRWPSEQVTPETFWLRTARPATST